MVRARVVSEDYVGPTSWDRALGVPEILSTIFQQATKHTKAVSLRVCRSWFDVGIKGLWHELDAMIPLFNLLAPMTFEPSEEGEGLWTGPTIDDLPPTNWKRFQLYASQVIKLVYDGNRPWGGHEQSHVSPLTIEAVAFHHPFRSSLLPNLKVLIWKSRPHAAAATTMSAIPFLSISLTRLELHHLAPYRPSVAMSLRSIFHSLEYRCPTLDTFLFNIPPECSLLEVDILTWLTVFKRLSHITLPPHFVSHRIMVALLGHTRLQTLRMSPILGAVLEDNGLPQCPLGSFKSLRTLELDVPCERAMDLFTCATFARLQDLTLTCKAGTSPEGLLGLTIMLSQSCLRLKIVHLYLQSSDTSLLLGDGHLTMEHIRPLLDCSHIKSLDLLRNYPFIISPSDIEEMATRWSRLGSLCLSPAPSVAAVWANPTAGNDIGVLQSFAQHLPSLYQLGLYINSTAPAPLLDEDIPLGHRFQKLARIAVGLSKVPRNDPVTVASFIESVTISTPKVMSGALWSYYGDPMSASLLDDVSRWLEAERAIHVLRKKRLVVTRTPSQ